MIEHEELAHLLSSNSGASDEMRSILSAGDAHNPSREELARLTARLTAALPPGTLPGAAATAGTATAGVAGTAATAGIAGAAKLGFFGKVVVGLAVASAIVAGGVVVSRRSTIDATDIPTIATTTPAPVERSVEPPSINEPPPALEPTVELEPAPTESAQASTSATSPLRSRASVPPPRASEEGRSEASLLGQAHEQVLRGSPEQALRLTEEDARSHPAGVLAQERELIAIEALVKLGRLPEAQARAAAFRRLYPGSSHLSRVESLVGEP